MAHEFHLPDIGEGLAEAVVVRWHVAVGDEVGLDEPLVEVETDKAVTVIPAPHGGVLLHQGAPAGATIAVEALLAVIGEPGEQWSPPAASSAPADAAPIVGTLEEAPAPAAGGPQALPRIRKLAAELGIDLAVVAGTGPGGRITEADLQSAAGGDVERVALSATRRAIAANLERSWREVPHVTTYGAADAADLLEVRRHRRDAGRVAPLEAHLVAAVLPALREFPAFNATWGGDHLLLRRHYDIGIAVDTDDGLMVVVIRGADAMAFDELCGEIVRLAEAARARTARVEDLRGATFTVSNIGAAGGGYGTPLIPHGTTAILSVGRAEARPAVRDGAIVPVVQLPLSLSYDHRAIDGAQGRRFLARVAGAIAGVEGAT